MSRLFQYNRDTPTSLSRATVLQTKRKTPGRASLCLVSSSMASVACVILYTGEARAQAAPPAAVVVSPAPATPPSSLVADESQDFGDRTMKGHTFIYPILQEGAFNTMHFGTRLGAAVFSVPNVPTGALGTLTLNAAGLAQDFDLGIEILPWLGVYGTGDGTVVTGSDFESAIVFGGQFSFSGEGGVVVRLVRVESTGTQVSARLFGGGGTGLNLDTDNLLTAVLGQTGQTLNTILKGGIGNLILTPTGSYTFGGSVHGAQALGRYVGLQLAVEGRNTWQTVSPYVVSMNANQDETTSTTAVSTSAGVDVDGSPAGVPLGAMVEYKGEFDAASPPSGASTTAFVNTIAVGLYYTGRRDLLLGLGGKTELGLSELGQSASIYYGQFLLRYIW